MVRGRNFSLCSSLRPCNGQTLLCPKIQLPVGAVSSSSVLPCVDTQPQIPHIQQQNDCDRSNVPERTQVLLLNTSCSHLHSSFFATGMSSGLAKRVTLTRVSRGVWRVYTTGMDPLPVSFLYHSTRSLLG
jgi:hypothetical protein